MGRARPLFILLLFIIDTKGPNSILNQLMKVFFFFFFKLKKKSKVWDKKILKYKMEYKKYSGKLFKTTNL